MFWRTTIPFKEVSSCKKKNGHQTNHMEPYVQLKWRKSEIRGHRTNIENKWNGKCKAMAKKQDLLFVPLQASFWNITYFLSNVFVLEISFKSLKLHKETLMSFFLPPRCYPQTQAAFISTETVQLRTATNRAVTSITLSRSVSSWEPAGTSWSIPQRWSVRSWILRGTPFR